MATNDPFTTLDVAATERPRAAVKHPSSPEQASAPDHASSPAQETAATPKRKPKLEASPEPETFETLPPGSAPSSFASQSKTVGPASSSAASSHGSRYDRVKELGRGGWGVVDRVIDRHLEREVAIKRIGSGSQNGSSAIDRDVRQRFLHEAKITSQLQHPGVVPVHELGTGPHGEAYYVMKLLEGDTLRQLIRTQHAPSRTQGHRWTSHTLRLAIHPLLDRFIDVCNALAYAHKQGVIHRDLKPANVMVGAFGETIVVDWGLAKRFAGSPNDNSRRAETTPRTEDEMQRDADHAVQLCEAAFREVPRASESGQHTTQGTIVGTPAYMSPEQAKGDVENLRPASDIYALGVMLYEMVAGQHPYRDLDLLAILQHIREGKWQPLRSVQPSVPKALAAICHKAMALDPAARYASAADLAEDVKRFIAGDAVHAYDEPLLDRIARFCRRHQTACVTAAAATVVLLVSAVTFSVLIHGAHQSERAARIESQASHRSALRSLIEARDAADAWLVDLSGSLEFYPGLEPIRVELLDNAISQYQRILSELRRDRDDIKHSPTFSDDDEEVRLMAGVECVRCELRLGDLHRLKGNIEEAASHYQHGRVALDELEREIETEHLSTEAQNSVRLQRINIAVGYQLFSSNDQTMQWMQDAQLAGGSTFEEDRKWLLSILPASPISLEPKAGQTKSFSAQAASTLARYHLVNHRSGVYQPGDETFERLIEAGQWAQWLVAMRNSPRDQTLYESIQQELANAYEQNHQMSLARDAWKALIVELESAMAAKSIRPDKLQSLAHAYIRFANCAATLQDVDDASDAYRKAIDVLNKAWQLLDVDSFHQMNLATAQHNLGRLMSSGSADAEPEALAMLRRSIATYSNLLQKEASPDTLRRLAEAHESLATLMLAERPQDAWEEFDRSELAYQLLAEHKHLSDLDAIHWASVLRGRSRCSTALGKSAEAQRDADEARRKLASLDLTKLSDTLLRKYETTLHAIVNDEQTAVPD